MNPEEKALLERSLKLSEDNNKILRALRGYQRWSAFWGFVKVCVFLVPFVVGYLYLEPYFGSLGDTFKKAETIIQTGYSQLPR